LIKCEGIFELLAALSGDSKCTSWEAKSLSTRSQRKNDTNSKILRNVKRVMNEAERAIERKTTLENALAVRKASKEQECRGRERQQEK